MTHLSARNAAMYINGTQYTHSTSLSLSLERPVAELQIQQQEYVEKDIGQYAAEFSGSGAVDDASKAMIGYVTAGTSKTVAIYPTNVTSDYWSFTAYFTTWAATGPVDGFWSIDFGGIVDGAISITGFA